MGCGNKINLFFGALSDEVAPLFPGGRRALGIPTMTLYRRRKLAGRL